MTQPIQEPGIERSLQGFAYARDQIFRRPAPSNGCRWCSTSAYFDSWTFNGTGASIPNDTWTNVVTGVDGANDRWFDEFNFDPDGEWGRNFATGAITTSATLAYLYSAWGFVVFDVPDNTWIGAAINWGGVESQINTGQTANGRDRIIVYAERVPLPAGGVMLQCWQQSGGAADLLEARLHVRRFERYQDIYTQEFAT